MSAGAILVILAATTSLCQSAPNEVLGSSIAAVERGLRPLVRIAGMPVEDTLAARMAYYHVPGVGIAVIHEGKVEWAKGYGVLEAGRPSPVTERTIFEAASISKPVADMAAMTLIQNGTIALDSPAERALKSWRIPASTFAANGEPTIRQIMAHTAGFNLENAGGYPAGEAVPTLLNVLNGKPPATNPPVRLTGVPGGPFQYSAGGMVVLQQVLVDTERAPFEQLAERALFKPLGMSRSTFQQPPPPKLRDDIAVGHAWDGTPMPLRLYPEMAAAGLRATPTDLARMILEMQNARQGHGKALTLDSAREMLKLQHDNPPMGLGFFLGGEGAARRFTYDGWNYGFTCRFVGFLEKGEGAVVMTNGDTGALMFEVLDAIGRAYSWPGQPRPQKEASSVPSDTAVRSEGRYAAPNGVEVRVMRLGTRLFLHLIPADPHEMEPFPPAELFVASPTEFFSLFPSMKVRFETDKTQKTVALVYDTWEHRSAPSACPDKYPVGSRLCTDLRIKRRSRYT